MTSDESIREPIGFIGLGAMGTPMSRSLLGRGWDVTGHDLDDSAVQTFIANGGKPAGRAAALATSVNLVVTSLPHSAALLEVIELLGDARPDSRPGEFVIIDTSTLSTNDREDARVLATDLDLVLLDCPVSGTSAQAEAGDLVGFLSGDDADALRRARRVLADMTRVVHEAGPYGNGTKLKLVANLLVAVHNLAAAEALLLAQRSGLDLDTVLKAVGDGAGGSRMFSVRGPMMAAETFEPATMRVETFQKDLKAIRELAAEYSSPVPLLAATTVFYDLAMSQGRSHQDTASVFGVLKHAAGPT
jgi:putative dehydrogenase